MINRENGLQEIYERLKANKTTLGIKTFKRTPTQPSTEADMPCIYMSEGRDNIIEHAKRNKSGYPARRVLEVDLTLIVAKGTDIKTLYNQMRRVVFTEQVNGEINPVLAENTFINENRTEGPTGYGLPDVVGMVLTLDLIYTDKAFYE